MAFHLAKYSALVSSIFSCILFIVACAGNHWIVSDDGAVSKGLWKMACNTLTSQCVDWTDVPSYIMTARALSILAILTSGIAILGCIANLYYSDNWLATLGHPYILSLILIFAAGFMIIGARVFQDHFSIEALMYTFYGWTWYMAYVSSFFAILCSTILILTKKYCRRCDDYAGI